MTLDRPIAWIDTETTGLDPVVDRIIEFGVVIMDVDLSISEQWVKRFNPGIPIAPTATAIHGIANQDVKFCPPFAEYAEKIAAGLRGRDIGGYNPWRLDLPMLDEEFRRVGGKLNLAGVRVYDAYGLWCAMEPRSLEDAVRRFARRQHEGSHGAGADAEGSADVFLGQLEAFGLTGRDCSEVADLSLNMDPGRRRADLAGKLYYDQDGELRYAFGKVRDVRVKDDTGFGWWMLKQDFPGSTIEILRPYLIALKNGQNPPIRDAVNETLDLTGNSA